jgi:hypothetical protein
MAAGGSVSVGKKGMLLACDQEGRECNECGLVWHDAEHHSLFMAGQQSHWTRQ